MKIKEAAEAILQLMRDCGQNKAAGEVGNWDAMSAQLNNIMQNLVNAHAARFPALQPVVRQAATTHQDNTRTRPATSKQGREIRFTGADFANAKKGQSRNAAPAATSQSEPANEVEVPEISTSNDNILTEFLNTTTVDIMATHRDKEGLEAFAKVFVPDFSFNVRLKDEEKMVAQVKDAFRKYLGDRLRTASIEEEE